MATSKTLKSASQNATNPEKLPWLKRSVHKIFRTASTPQPKRLPSVRKLSRTTVLTLAGSWKVFLGIALVYALLSLVLVRGLGTSVDVDQLKSQTSPLLGGVSGQVLVNVSAFATLLSSGNTASSAAGAYQLMLTVVISLATIWALRQVLAGKYVRLRDAFYRGMYPLVPFVLVLLVVLLQTVPALIGGLLYNLAVTYGVAYSTPEKLMWGGLFAALAWVSIYMLCSSLFALYIVALPDMTPMKALRSARELVRYRRSAVFIRLFLAALVLLLVMVITIMPLVAILPAAAPWALFIYGIVGLIVANVYMYVLYRELLA